MSLPFLFANVSQLNTPELDSDFAAVGAGVTYRCTATGTNTIALTPAANQAALSAYFDGLRASFIAAASTTASPVTINIGGLGAKNVYKNNGATLIGANDFAVGGFYEVAYNAALNGAVGGWVVINAPATTGAAGAIQAQFKNLLIQPSSNTLCPITADAVAVSDGSTSFTTLLNVSVTVNSGASGVNGLDTGALSASTWYYLFVIYNPSTLTTAGLMSLSPTAPTMPAGYTQRARVGAVRTDASSRFLRTIQKNYRAQYVLNATTPTAFPTIVLGATGPGPTAQSVAAVVPSTAGSIWIVGVTSPNLQVFWMAANAQGSVTAGAYVMSVVGNTSFASSLWGEIELESTNIYTGMTGGTMSVYCTGWSDNL